ncbi:rhodanese-like domain-containing protein [Thiocapsa bogorovii]|uniref:rhodanese-like domain-containing protein n=1 Tax=Thiocapsa bogorovii TaxID=521689 RepID=UPI001E47F3F6|nr:rhodanese-like domain-containing protein [Thiocapsa bogorovii]UHD16319.1 rhodanese-like domain-containing protein [Thiocapsa bogorovii]
MPKQTTTTMLLIVLASTLAGSVLAADNRISADLESVDVIHNGQTVTIQRGHDRDATLPAMFQKTDRGCPPFCVQPIVALPGIGTIGELEVLDYLRRKSQGDDSILVVDSRTPDWVMRGTIPGAINIPWNRISSDAAGTFETPEQADAFRQILADEFDGTYDAESDSWDFTDAKTLVLFCNGLWCGQSTENIKTLVDLGYPLHKLKWYRGGMQDWVSVGLTTVKP